MYSRDFLADDDKFFCFKILFNIEDNYLSDIFDLFKNEKNKLQGKNVNFIQTPATRAKSDMLVFTSNQNDFRSFEYFMQGTVVET